MRFVLNPYIAVSVACLALLAAWMIWYVLVRPVPEKTGFGVITGRRFQQAERVEQQMPRTGPAAESAPRTLSYTLPDRYVYEVRVEGEDTGARYAAPSAGTPSFEVGQRVRIVYGVRSIPFVGKRIYVRALKPADG